jgi:hypothetical protein
MDTADQIPNGFIGSLGLFLFLNASRQDTDGIPNDL